MNLNKTDGIYGSGGMKTKIEAAKICQLAGCYMVIANGNFENPIKLPFAILLFVMRPGQQAMPDMIWQG